MAGAHTTDKKRKVKDDSHAQHDKKRPKAMVTGKGGAPPSAPPAKLSSKERKDVVKQKKLKVKKNFSLIEEAVRKWEVLRQKSTSKEEKEALVQTIMQKLKGKLLELSNHHTASRIIQFCAKHGSESNRSAMMSEVKSNVIPLAKSKYGHFLVRKLINVTKKEDINDLVKLFKGKMAELLRHPYGADVAMDLYDLASTQQRNAMCAEFYGREFCLFDGVTGNSGDIKSLAQAISDVPFTKRRNIIQFMSKQLLPTVEKALLHPPMMHRLVRDYLEAAPASGVEDVVDTLSATGGGVLKMVHTHEGAHAACMVLAYGSPKDRKRVLKGMKGYVKTLASDEWGHAVLCTAVSVTDDTAIVQKIIIQEYQADLAAMLESKHARRVVLQLLSPDCHRYFPMHILHMMHPPQRTVKGTSGKMVSDFDGDEDDAELGAASEGEDDDFLKATAKGTAKHKTKPAPGAGEEDGDEDDEEGGSDEDEMEDEEEGVEAEGEEEASVGAGGDEEGEEEKSGGGARVLGVSKKDGRVRRIELLKGEKKGGLGAKLVEHCVENVGDMLRSPVGSDVVVEVCRGGDGGVLAEVVGDALGRVHEAVAKEVGRSKEGAEEVGPLPKREHVLVDYFASRALRRLVLSSAEEGEGGAGARRAVEAMWKGGLKGNCKAWVGTHADKVLGALLHCGLDGVRKGVEKEIKGVVKGSLAEWSKRFVVEKGSEANGKERKQAGGKKT